MIHHPAPPGLAHGESGHLEPVQEFPYEQVDADLGNTKPADDSRIEAAEQVVRVLLKLLRWLWQNGLNEKRGLQLRAAVLVWAFVPEINCLNQTELARHYGVSKQAIGKWSSNFKLEFPEFPNVHFRYDNTKTHARNPRQRSRKTTHPRARHSQSR